MASLHQQGLLIAFLLAGQLLSPVQTLPVQAEESRTVSTTATDESSTSASGEEGIASYYAKRYNNRRTNSGQLYKPDKLTAAHPTLPHGTRVKVVNLKNKKEVIVTVNDRCRPKSGPFIDLSRAAAKQLGFLGKGTARVQIIPLDKGRS
jgi:rare lipoprotein A